MSERLDRIEALVEANSQAIAEAASERQELRKVIEANSRAIAEAASERQEFRQVIAEAASERHEFRQVIAEAASERHEFRQAIAEASQERQELREVFQETLKVVAEMSQRQDERNAENKARIQKLDENIDALVTLTGRVTEQTAQLKSAVDYLHSKDVA